MKNQIHIRLATPADDAAVGDVLVNAFLLNYSQKMPEVVVSEKRKADLRDVAAKRKVAIVWVAEFEGCVVGTVALWPQNATGSEAFLPNSVDLRHLGVDASVKGMGISKMLLDVAEAHARTLNASSICLHVRRGAKGVRQLYESRGYVRHEMGDLDFLPDVYLEAFALTLSI